MRILGIDPGLETTGYGCVLLAGCDAPRLIEGGILSTRSAETLERRLATLHAGMTATCRELKPDVVVVEELYSHYAHPRTAILMGHARGVLLLAAGTLDVPVRSYAATRIKKALTGNGRASKAQVQAMVQRRFGLEALPEPPDVADALAVALCHANVETHGAGLGATT